MTQPRAFKNHALNRYFYTLYRNVSILLHLVGKLVNFESVNKQFFKAGEPNHFHKNYFISIKLLYPLSNYFALDSHWPCLKIEVF